MTSLVELGACSEAVDWVGDRPLSADLWAECPRGDWLLWYAARVGADRRLIVRAACLCAREVLRYVPDGEDRPRVAIETAEAWARGEASLEEVRLARDAAYAAADAARAAYAAASAAADAARAARAAAIAPGVAYATADLAADADAARATSLARSADIVRSVISWSDCIARETRLTRFGD